MAHRIAKTDNGVICLRCHGFVSSSSASVLGCACTDAHLRQFASEPQPEQQLVTSMLFMQRMADDTRLPMEKRIEYTKELKKLYNENQQLAMRNNVGSPFSSGS